MPRLSWQLDFELSETVYGPTGHPVAVRAERLKVVCTSWVRAVAELERRHAESEVLGVVIRPI